MGLHPLLLDAAGAGLGRTFLLVLLPVVASAAGVYWLLPRPRDARPLWGAILGGLGTVLAGWLLIHSGMARAETVLFYAFAGIALVGGAMLIAQRNPVHAALSFALVVLSTCGLFLLQAAPFLMAATIIIYAGAIIVTFLFVVMLAQQQGISSADQRSREPLLSCIAGFVLLGAILMVLNTTYDNKELAELVDGIGRAARANSLDEVKQTLGDGNDVFKALRQQKLNARLTPEQNIDFERALSAAEEKWNARNRNLNEIKAALVKLHQESHKIRDGFGSLDPPASSSILPPAGGKRRPLELSSYSRLDASGSGNAPSRAASRGVLPADNVGYLGRTLFSDYLLAVELGGTLLLVATIGAIAIAARRREGLR